MPTTATTVKQRISDFQERINRKQNEIREQGDLAWKAISRGQSEPKIIEQFLRASDCGTAFLNQQLAPLLSVDGRVVKFASVFLHQCPYVEGWEETGKGDGARRTLIGKRCELGDLQTLFIYLTADKTIAKLRSVIFQAKKEPHSGDYVIDHDAQRRLYDRCQGFTYRSPDLDGDRRFPAGPNRERALQYLFVGEEQVRAHTIPADAGVGAFVDFGEHLLRFLNDSTGMEVPPTPDESVGWNRIVWDMMRFIARKATNGLARNDNDDDFRVLLDQFNSFESKEIYHLGSDERGEGYYGLQLVIVWDPQLDEYEAVAASLPPLLRQLAKKYDRETHIADDVVRIRLKDDLAREMAAIVVHEKVSHEDIAKAARQLKSNGLIAALGDAVDTSPRASDAALLLKLLPVATWEHAVKRLLAPLLALVNKGQVTRDQMKEVLTSMEKHCQAAKPHVHTLVGKLAAVIKPRLASLRAQTEQTIHLRQTQG